MKYSKKPEKIKLKKSESKYCVCNNCFDTNYVYKITLNETNFETPKGNIGKNPYAKKYELWLCKKCLKEFFESEQLLAIHLKTKEQSIIFSKEADKLGKKWSSEASYLEFNFWDGYKEKTCYDNEGMFADIFYYGIVKKCKVLSFEDIEWEE